MNNGLKDQKVKNMWISVFTMVLTSLISTTVLANNDDDVIINYEVTAINEMEIDNVSVSLLINTTTAGEQPEPDQEYFTYDITTNGTNMNITGALDQNMPVGFTLFLHLWTPGSGSSTARNLSTTSKNLVTGLTRLIANNINGHFQVRSPCYFQYYNRSMDLYNDCYKSLMNPSMWDQRSHTEG